MLPELPLAILVSAIPTIMYILTAIATKLGPNPLIGFRISPRMQDPTVWQAVHRALLPSLRRQTPLTLCLVPLVALLVLAPAAFPFVLLGCLGVMLVTVAVVVRRAFSELNSLD